MSEEDVRRIVREEIAAGLTDKQRSQIVDMLIAFHERPCYSYQHGLSTEEHEAACARATAKCQQYVDNLREAPEPSGVVEPDQVVTLPDVEQEKHQALSPDEALRKAANEYKPCDLLRRVVFLLSFRNDVLNPSLEIAEKETGIQPYSKKTLEVKIVFTVK